MKHVMLMLNSGVEVIGILMRDNDDSYTIQNPIRLRMFNDPEHGSGLQYERYTHFVKTQLIEFPKDTVRHLFNEDELLPSIIKCYGQLLSEIGEDEDELEMMLNDDGEDELMCEETNDERTVH